MNELEVISKRWISKGMNHEAAESLAPVIFLYNEKYHGMPNGSPDLLDTPLREQLVLLPYEHTDPEFEMWHCHILRYVPGFVVMGDAAAIRKLPTDALDPIYDMFWKESIRSAFGTQYYFVSGGPWEEFFFEHLESKGNAHIN